MSEFPDPIACTNLLLEMDKITRGDLPRDEALNRIARLVLDEFAFDSVALLIYEAASKSVFVASSVGKGSLPVSPDITLRIDDASCLMHSARNPHRPLFLSKGYEDSVLGRLEGVSVAVVPMNLGREVTGFMMLAREKEPPFFGTNPNFVMALATQAAVIVSKARLMENLKQSEERYHKLTKNAKDLVFALDRGGRFLYVNSQSVNMLGYSPDELCGRYFGEFVKPESWATTISILKDAVRNKLDNIEYSWAIQTKDGPVVNLDIRASLIYRDFELFSHQGIAKDTSREKQLWKEIEKREKALGVSRNREERMREYLSVADLAQEEERARIARELHDGAIQYLVALRRKFDLLEKNLPTIDLSQDIRSLFTDIDSLMDMTIGDLREFARNLRPPVLDDFGFVSACEWLCDQVEKDGFHTVFHVSGSIPEIRKEVEASVFRIIQEGLSNAVKHSEATIVQLRLVFEDNMLRIEIQDNGKGFDSSKVAPGSLVRAGQMGLVGMYERSELLGASIQISSEPGLGTVLTVSIPLKT